MGNSIKVTPARMVILGMGWLGSHFFWGFYTGSMPLFLRDFTESKFVIAVALSLAGVTNCIMPPVVGYLSDRTHSRFGRRRPYIFLGMLGVFFCLVGLPHAPAFGVVVVVSTVMYLSMACVETPLASLLPDITPTEQRGTVSGVVHLLGSVGLVIFFVVSSRIWDEHPAEVFYLVAFVSLGAALITVARIKEPGIEAAPSSPPPLGYLRSLARETDALKFFAAEFFWWLGSYMISSFITLFAVEELRVTEGMSLLVPIPLTVTYTIFILPMGMLADRLGRKRILSCMALAWAATGLLIGLSQNFAHALVTVGLAGIPFAAIAAIGYIYLLDLIPKERTAEFTGLHIISMSAPMVVGPMISGALIDVLGFRAIFPAAALMTCVGFAILQFTRQAQKPAPAEEP